MWEIRKIVLQVLQNSLFYSCPILFLSIIKAELLPLGIHSKRTLPT